MLLGKRPRLRPPIRRTTSMTQFAADIEVAMDEVNAQQPSDEPSDWMARSHVAAAATAAGILSPRNNYRRNSADYVALETAPFLKACGLCNRRLGPGRDIYMYRGEVAFCSLECRQQLINQEERKEKCSLATITTEAHETAATTRSEACSSGNETVAAA